MNVKAIITSHIITQPRQSEWHGEAPAWRFAHVGDKCPPHASRATRGLFTNVSQEEGPKSWR